MSTFARRALPILYAVLPVLLRLAYALDPERTRQVVGEVLDVLDEFEGADDE